MLKQVISISTVAAFAAAGTANAELLISSFEDDGSGGVDLSVSTGGMWDLREPGAPENGFGVSLAGTTSGVTEGSQALSITSQAVDFDGIVLRVGNAGLRTGFTTYGYVAVDITVPDTAVERLFGWTVQGSNQPFTPITAGTAAVGETTTFYLEITPELAAAAGEAVTPNWWQLGIRLGGSDQSGGDIVTYVDNVRFTDVPEPASLGLVALGVAAITSRRRRSN